MSYRDRLDVEALLTALDIKFTRQGVKLRAICPNPDHKDSDPSWAIIDNPGSDKHGGHWCLAAETKVLTWDGYRRIDELAGKTARVLTVDDGGYSHWVDAPFKSYGKQRLWKLVVRRNGVRKTIRATAEHRWFVKVAGAGKPARWVQRYTSELIPNHSLRGAAFPHSPTISVSPWGVAHGVTFGDGTLVTRSKMAGAKVVLWGEKDASLKAFFPLSTHRVGCFDGQSYIDVGGLPRGFKQLPALNESASYLYGWLAGYFAADGCVDESGCPTIASANREHLEFVRKICIRLGVFTYGVREQRRLGRGQAPTDLFFLTFARSSLTEAFFLIAEHRKRWLAGRDVRERRGWVVESVEPTDDFEEVFCAEVEGTHNFALEDNLLTGNCFSCKYGGGPWELVRAVRGVDEEQASLFVHQLITGAPRPFPGVPRVIVRESKAAEEFRLPPEVRIPSLDDSEWPDVFRDYIAMRGVTHEQLVRWRIGYATRGPLAWRIVIPVHTRGRLVAHVGRAVFDDRERYDMPKKKFGARPALAVFGEPLINPALRVLTIAEGSFSMLALERAGAPNPVALLGSDWSPGKAAVLSSVDWDLIVIATDPDAAGDRVARDIAASYRKSTIRRLRMDRSPDDCGLLDLKAAVRSALAA